AAQQRAFISNTTAAPSQALVESISTKIRELLPRDPDLAQILAETNLYIASVVNTPLAWAYANRSRAQVLYTMRKSAEADPYFEITQENCERHGVTLWAASADRGISQMHFRRGNYSTALRILEQVRRRHEELGDARRVGLCDMDRAEIYLKLNLFDDAAKIAL